MKNSMFVILLSLVVGSIAFADSKDIKCTASIKEGIADFPLTHSKRSHVNGREPLTEYYAWEGEDKNYKVSVKVGNVNTQSVEFIVLDLSTKFEYSSVAAMLPAELSKEKHALFRIKAPDASGVARELTVFCEEGAE